MPELRVRQLYTFGSLRNAADGFCFGIKNRLSDAVVTGLAGLLVDGHEIPASQLWLEFAGGATLPAAAVTPESPLAFALRATADIHAVGAPLADGRHEVQFVLETTPFGSVAVTAEDAVTAAGPSTRVGIPYDKDDGHNYSRDMAEARRHFVEAATGIPLRHVGAYSFDPAVTRGNIENFTGVAQMPIGFAGPLRINGEHAQGEFLIPLATTEGTLVASYNRGMKVLNLAGGVTCTVSADCMQRAPVFVFASAREARDFRDWVEEHTAEIRGEAEATSRVARLLYIDTYLANKFAFLRFNYTTGDAAGQNMVGRATFAACSWILHHASGSGDSTSSRTSRPTRRPRTST